ncbi:MAG: hypothetical protein Q8O67_10265 [Deltaproteobacteria bacterium]|nr:hypothetical protein [Deltaproteobacteria bacterium]
MPKRWITTAYTDRAAVVIDNAELLADEACDVELFTEADALRLLASRLKIHVEEAEARTADVTRARQERTQALAVLRRASHRFCLEIETRLPFEDAALLLTMARLSVEPSTRYRLQRITTAQRAALGAVMEEITSALDAFHKVELRTFETASQEYVTRARVLALTYELRNDSERMKAMLLVVVPPRSDAFKRVSRLVVRTKRPDAWFQRVLK